MSLFTHIVHIYYVYASQSVHAFLTVRVYVDSCKFILFLYNFIKIPTTVLPIMIFQGCHLLTSQLSLYVFCFLLFCGLPGQKSSRANKTMGKLYENVTEKNDC